MSKSRLRVEARQPLRAFRVSEIPDHIRARAVHRDAYNQGRTEGLAGVPLLSYVLEVTAAAWRPSDRLHFVSLEAWDAMLEDADRMQQTGSAKRWLELAAGNPVLPLTVAGHPR